MNSTKRRPAKRARKSRRTEKKLRSGRRSPIAAAPEVSLQQGVFAMATIGAQSLLWLATLAAGVAVLAGLGFGLWSLRPVPAYVSERATVVSPFSATFRIENTSAWFPLVDLKIRCAVEGVDAPDMPPVEADSSRIPARLGPGEQASFTCPFHGGDPDVALRSELYFHSEYDLPVIGRWRLGDSRGPFVLNTKLLPPRWTAKPGRD